MNWLNRTCSTEAWKATFPSSSPKTTIAAFRSEWDFERKKAITITVKEHTQSKIKTARTAA